MDTVQCSQISVLVVDVSLPLAIVVSKIAQSVGKLHFRSCDSIFVCFAAEITALYYVWVKYFQNFRITIYIVDISSVVSPVSPNI
jgi:hypothetical protein